MSKSKITSAKIDIQGLTLIVIGLVFMFVGTLGHVIVEQASKSWFVLVFFTQNVGAACFILGCFNILLERIKN